MLRTIAVGSIATLLSVFAAPAAYTTERSVSAQIVNGPPVPVVSGEFTDTAPSGAFGEFAFDGAVEAFTGVDRRLHVRDTVNHRTLWTAAVSSSLFAPAIAGSRVYAIDPDGELVARDEFTGSVRWKTPRLHVDGYLQIVEHGDAVFVVGNGVECVDVVTGRVRWHAASTRSRIDFGTTAAFVSSTKGEEFAEDVRTLDLRSGKLLSEYSPPNATPIASTLTVTGNEAIVRAATQGPSIDLDRFALARLVWLDGRDGTVVKNWAYRPDLQRYGPDTGLAEPVLIDGQTVLFQVLDTVYSYALNEPPELQRPLRFDGQGELVFAAGGLIYVGKSDGLYSLKLRGQQAIAQRIITYRYNSRYDPNVAISASAVAVSDGRFIWVHDLATHRDVRYSAPCGNVFQIEAVRGRLAVRCGDAANRNSVNYAGTL